MTDLIEFLRARLDEDAERWRHLADQGEQGYWDFHLAEVDAKRRLLAVHTFERKPGAHDCPGEWAGYSDDPDEPCPTLRLLALPYADHPSYREEWRP